RPEGPVEELRDGRREVSEAQREGRRLPALTRRLLSEGEQALPDRRFHPDRTLRVPTREGVSTHEQQLKDEHGEAKAVVFRRSQDTLEALALELRRGEQGSPDPTRIGAPEVRDLEGVAVDEPHGRLLRDDDVTL